MTIAVELEVGPRGSDHSKRFSLVFSFFFSSLFFFVGGLSEWPVWGRGRIEKCLKKKNSFHSFFFSLPPFSQTKLSVCFLLGFTEFYPVFAGLSGF